jgi:large subunit ribosomal protein L5
MASRLKERYEREIKPGLIERFGYKSPMQAPRIEKITLNMGVGEAKLNTAMLDAAGEQLAVISGQKPTVRRARKSIANFKLREGMPVGVKVTLRGERMYEMLDRLQSIAIPRIRDFRGLNGRSFDGRGNYSLGIKEQIIFPEVDYDSIDQVRGLDVTITTTAATDEEAYELLRRLGMPFRDEDGAGTPAARTAREPAAEPAAAPAEPEAARAEPEVEVEPEPAPAEAGPAPVGPETASEAEPAAPAAESEEPAEEEA